jgi:hypothetical protein
MINIPIMQKDITQKAGSQRNLLDLFWHQYSLKNILSLKPIYGCNSIFALQYDICVYKHRCPKHRECG